VELYDLSTDPAEEHDLAAAQRERAEEMRKKLAEWRTAVDAQMPTPNPDPVEPFGPKGCPEDSREVTSQSSGSFSTSEGLTQPAFGVLPLLYFS
jgi:hypothetical protein